MNFNQIFFKIILIFGLFILSISGAFSQQPAQINYQAVARKTDGTPLSDQNIRLRLSILDGIVSGSMLYSETRQVITNKFGLFSVVIGSAGNLNQQGSMNSVNWVSGNKYLRVEIDPLGGTNFTELGTSQLQAVPFALYANNAFPIGEARGDLSGTFPNPTVNKLNGRLISTNTPINGQVLKWDGNSWTPANENSTGGIGPQGPKGDTGAIGPQGIAGVAGQKGDKGDQGEMGPQGIAGVAGQKGDKGDQGEMGPQGIAGVAGQKGDKGDQGEMGPQGIAGVAGQKGDKGDQGEMGLQGIVGVAGQKGDKGDQGEMGLQGIVGVAGQKGDKGDQGEMGPQGIAGVDGKTILNGISNPDFSVGTDGDFYLNTTNYELFGPKTNGSWPIGVSIKSETGDFVDLTTNQNIGGLKIFSSNAGFLATGNVSQGDTISLGAGSRMMWYPQKAAFRAGFVSGKQWDHYRIGYHSFASGENTVASANYTSAMGINTLASGNYSMASGNTTKASGLSSFAMGGGTEASGDYSAVFGAGAKASANGSFAAGSGTEASGSGAVAFGSGNRASGLNSFSSGAGNQAIGTASVAFGSGTKASGLNSFVMGIGTEASGDYSLALGLGTHAPSYTEMVLGSFNTVYIPSSSSTFVDTDRLFTLGNGINENQTSDALIVLKNGNTTINGSLTAAGLTYPNTTGDNGDILTSNGNGALIWQAPSSGSTPQFNFSTGEIPFSDGIGNLISKSALLWDDTNGSLNIFSKNDNSFSPSLRVYPNPNNQNTPTWMRLGDNGTGAEFGISGGNGQFFQGTVKGDAVIKAFSGSDDKKLFIGAGLNSAANIILSPNGATSISGTNYPTNYGTAGQVLTTDGQGTATWSNLAGGNINFSAGVSGILAISNGGTGSSTKNFVDLSTSQIINGTKTFSSDLMINGLKVGKGNGDQSNNTAIGFEAINSNTNIGGAGVGLSAFGYQALKSNLYGSNNTALGLEALKSNTNGEYNTAVGSYALPKNITGSNNVSVGFSSLDLNTNSFNTGIGSMSLADNTSGSKNTGLGFQSLISNSTGSNNTAIGYNANVAAINLNNATAIGSEAVVDESNSIRLGNSSILKVKTSGKLITGTLTFPNTDGTSGQVLGTDGSGNIGWINQSSGVGSFVDLNSTQTIGGSKTFSNDLTVNGIRIGHGAGNRADNFTLGANSMNNITDGTYNSAVGISALTENTNGTANTAFGYYSLNQNSIGDYNTAIGSYTLIYNAGANYNTAIGHGALLRNSTGNSNIGIGYMANEVNTMGNENIAIGFESGVISNNLSNTIALGHQAKARANNQAVIGTSTIAEVLMGEGLAVVKGGNYISSSDARLKENIRTINYGLKDILLLNPVNFSWKKDKREDLGFIAQEVKKIIPELVSGVEGDISKNETLGVNYSQMVSILTKAIQEQQVQIEELKQVKITQDQHINELKNLVNQLLEKVK